MKLRRKQMLVHLLIRDGQVRSKANKQWAILTFNIVTSTITGCFFRGQKDDGTFVSEASRSALKQLCQDLQQIVNERKQNERILQTCQY